MADTDPTATARAIIAKGAGGEPNACQYLR
jgi:hypothetical protein